MTNHPKEEALALYSTGDLDQRELRSIAVHVAGCPDCCDCIAQFARVEALLASAAAEPSAAELLEVRELVVSALNGARKRRNLFEWAAAVAAVIALAVLLRYHRQRPAAEFVPKPPRIAVVHAPAVTTPANVPLPKPVAVRRRRLGLASPGLRSVALVMRPGEEPLIKIATSDPKVVILLRPDAPENERTESNDD